MRKIAVLLIFVLLCLPFSAVAENSAAIDAIRNRLNRAQQGTPAPEEPAPEVPVFDDPMMNIAMELIFDVHAVANDENYLSLSTTMELEYIPALAATDPYDLRSIHRIVIPEAALKVLVGFDMDLSPAAMSRVNRMIATEVPSQWNRKMDFAALAEYALLVWSKPYPMPEGFSPCSWLVDCGGALYWIGFEQSGEDIITAHISPVWLAERETLEDKLAYFDPLPDLISVQQIWPPAE